MPETSSSTSISTRLERIAELARQAPTMVLTTLAHHIDIDWLREAYARTRKSGAAGVDGQTAEQYAEHLESNLQALLERAKSGTYQAPPVRRVFIPKEGGEGQRPLGIPTSEDKVLQRAVAMVLEAVYEQSFLDCSYGFRPGRSAHDALNALRNELMAVGGGWVLEADIRKYFDNNRTPPPVGMTVYDIGFGETIGASAGAVKITYLPYPGNSFSIRNPTGSLFASLAAALSPLDVDIGDRGGLPIVGEGPSLVGFECDDLLTPAVAFGVAGGAGLGGTVDLLFTANRIEVSLGGGLGVLAGGSVAGGLSYGTMEGLNFGVNATGALPALPAGFSGFGSFNASESSESLFAGAGLGSGAGAAGGVLYTFAWSRCQ